MMRPLEHSLPSLGRAALALALCALLAGCSDDAANQSKNNAANNNANNNISGDMGDLGAGGDMDPDADMAAGDMAPGDDMQTSGDMAGGDMAGDMDPDADMPDPGDMSGFDLPDTPFMVNDMGQILCGDAPCQCSDGVDDDGDGKIDGFDPECTGPFDNDEASFATGIPGDNQDPVWQDCFFDGNSGSGDDGCRYKTGCLTGALPSTDRDCQLSQRCLDFCKPRTPNGCDCFGCCEVFKDDGTSVNIVIGTDCSLADIDDPNACPRCEQSAQCVNTCGRCELCLGKALADLPADCFPPPPVDMGTDMPTSDMGTDMPVADMGADMPADMPPADMGPPLPYTCEGGVPACSPSVACPTDRTYYCYLGCCIEYSN